MPAGPKGPFGPACGYLLHTLRAPRITSSYYNIRGLALDETVPANDSRDRALKVR